MNNKLWWAAAGLAALLATPAHAELSQVKVWAAACANCHGTNGKAQEGMESLAGKNEDDLYKKLINFKTGKAPATIMHQLSKGYSDEQLKQLAAHFAAQPK